jgi:hypothetical protein
LVHGQAGRAELGQEVAHAGFAAGDAIGLEHAHLRPAHAEGIADDVVERFDGADIVLDQPQASRQTASSRRSPTKASISLAI